MIRSFVHNVYKSRQTLKPLFPTKSYNTYTRQTFFNENKLISHLNPKQPKPPIFSFLLLAFLNCNIQSNKK